MNEHGRICASHFFDDLQNLHNLWTFSNYLLITMDKFISFALFRRTVVFKRLVDLRLNKFRLERFFQKIICSKFSGLNRPLN